MTRSVWKGPFSKKNILNKLHQQLILNTEKKNNNSVVDTIKDYVIYNKALHILPIFVNQKVRIYNGHKFTPIKITPHHVGYKFGHFVTTRRLFDKGKGSKFKKNMKARKKATVQLKTFSKQKINLLSKKRYRYRSLKVLKLL